MFNADCMEAMAAMSDKQYDLAIVDPPYGIGISGQRKFISRTNAKHNRKKHDDKGWDNAIPTVKYFNDLFRVSANRIICGGNYYTAYLPPTKSWIFWYKGQQGLTMSDGELLWTSFNTPTRMVEYNRVELLKDGTFHPTQKPVALYKWILTNYAKPGQTILDTHGGSGSICIACHDLGFDLDWYELDKEYYDKACERFERHKQQQRLL